MAVRITGKRVLVGVGVVLVVAIALIVIPALRHKPYVPELDDFGPVPAFSFTDEQGQPFSPREMAGRVTVINFIFTRCDNVCPMSTAHMLDVQERTGDLPDRIAMVSFTVDPANDTPAVLARYAKDFHADPRRWFFVTGPFEVTRTIAEDAFKTAMDAQDGVTESGAPNILHGQHFALVDQNLHIRKFYDTEDAPTLDKLIRDARYLARHPDAAARPQASASASR
jgi:protein SCO1